MILNFMPGPEDGPGEGGQGMGPEQGEESATPPPEAPQEEAPETAEEHPAETTGKTEPYRMTDEQFNESWDRISRKAFISHESAMWAEVLPKAKETAARVGEKAMLMAAGMIGLKMEKKTETAPGGGKEATGKMLRAFSMASFKLGGYEIFVAPFAGVDHSPKSQRNQRPLESFGLTHDDLTKFAAENTPAWRRRKAA